MNRKNSHISTKLQRLLTFSLASCIRHCGYVGKFLTTSAYYYFTVEPKNRPPPPRRNSSKEAIKILSSQKQGEESKQENVSSQSPKRSIVRPRVWVDTSHLARDNSIKVTSAYLKKDVKQLKIQLKELRNQHEYNSHIFYSMISKTGKRIAQAIEVTMLGKLV